MTHRRRGVLTSERRALGAEIREARTEGPPSRPRLRVLVPSQESAAEFRLRRLTLVLLLEDPFQPPGCLAVKPELVWKNSGGIKYPDVRHLTVSS